MCFRVQLATQQSAHLHEKCGTRVLCRARVNLQWLAVVIYSNGAGALGGGGVRACNHTPHYSAELAGGLSIVFRGIEASNKQKRSERMEESAGCTARAAMGDGVGAHPTAAPWLFQNARRGC